MEGRCRRDEDQGFAAGGAVHRGFANHSTAAAGYTSMTLYYSSLQLAQANLYDDWEPKFR